MPTAPSPGSFAGLSTDGSPGHRFKKHKILPHPTKGSLSSLNGSIAGPKKYDLRIDTTSSTDSGSLPPSPRALRHQARRIGSGPDLPPTPPAHSRTSSSSHSALPSSPTCIESPARSTDDVSRKQPTTPVNQRSPPTPDVTPPQAMPERRPRLFRPVITDRIPSKTTTDSRTESFKTARENPETSDEEDGRSTLRAVLPSAKTSQSTVRQSPREGRKKIQPVGLGLGLESSVDESLTPRSKGEFGAFDGEWGGSSSEVEQEWDYNLERSVTVRKRSVRNQVNGHQEVLEDVTVSPTNAAKAVRSMTLPERIMALPSPPQDTPGRMRPRIASGPNPSESSVSTDTRRFSGMSSKSTVSTVVEAVLVDNTPKRQRTLRHVRKNMALRDSNSDLSPTSSAPTSVGQDEWIRRRPAPRRYHDVRHDSLASTGTVNSIMSRKARRDVWKNGGIPVVIVPERQSSVRSSAEPSLRSTSSRRSKRSQSLHSVPLSQISKSHDLTPLFDRPSRRGKPNSESDGSAPGDQRTMDYPPAVPRRTSSLSAPTSRNTSRAGSRAGSLTAESLKAHNVLQNQMHIRQNQVGKDEETPTAREAPEVTVREAPSADSLHLAKNHPDAHKLTADAHRELHFGRLSAKNTPFSQISVETNGTSHHSHAEVSEALAVNIYPHQNTSVLMVDHSNRPSEVWQSGHVKEDEQANGTVQTPVIKTTAPDDELPVTPPQPKSSQDEVDSPLRNPRAPPEPPVLKLIPATPSGLTPMQEKEKQLGNFFEEPEVPQEKPKRSVSLVRRALGQRRYSEYGPSASRRSGFLTRTLSLTRGTHRRLRTRGDLDDDMGPVIVRYSISGSEPADETRLHPFWRPASSYQYEEAFDDDDDDEGFVRDAEGESRRYPPITRRAAAPPRRSFSARVKRTFAILPINDPDDDYLSASPDGPERRTVRRTPSGALRVVKHRASLDSLRRYAAEDGRPFTAPEQRGRSRRYFWQPQTLLARNRSSSSSSRRENKWTRIFPGLGTKLVEYGPANLPRRISERRREKRTRELREKISGPREVRDGVGDVIRRRSYKDAYTQAQAA
ncbi:uncharacterized protein E0L32_000015 [Thyridium curvatum]|uniref:Uncharacterized protein n=1 Tax=Thyridium curvatum TaxID=1093900 RepID=A0A507BFE3_9PEZI|nr:uncharacterized protein E0L32_000015 [Thyridium curvatum]TPX15681.1 hypothetical protein E0L32_000015 [Thyridium curvatum]